MARWEDLDEKGRKAEGKRRRAKALKNKKFLKPEQIEDAVKEVIEAVPVQPLALSDVLSMINADLSKAHYFLTQAMERLTK